MSIGAIIIGCITGFVSAFFGIGGSSIDTPLLRTFLHLSPYIALGSPLPTAFLTIFIALATYWKKHLVNYRIFKLSLLGGLPGIILGSYVSKEFSGNFLMILSALVLFFVGVSFVIKTVRAKRNKLQKVEEIYYRNFKPASAMHVVSISFLANIFSGVLAIGGGLFLIPAYVMLFNLKIKEAIATSLLTVTIMILPACIIHYNLGHIDFGISAAMSIGVIPMAYFGAKMDLETDAGAIQMLFGLMLVMFSLYFLVSQVA